MKPAPFTYHDPRSVTEAVTLLAEKENARLLAGGQSLMPMMNFRYAMPDHVIDLNRVAELSYIRVEGHALDRFSAQVDASAKEVSLMLTFFKYFALQAASFDR